MAELGSKVSDLVERAAMRMAAVPRDEIGVLGYSAVDLRHPLGQTAHAFELLLQEIVVHIRHIPPALIRLSPVG
jgi:hypothetical protein